MIYNGTLNDYGKCLQFLYNEHSIISHCFFNNHLINIENRPYYFLNNIINIKNFEPNLLNIIPKYLIFVSTEKNKEVLEKCTELWDEIKNPIKTINGDERMNIKKIS